MGRINILLVVYLSQQFLFNRKEKNVSVFHTNLAIWICVNEYICFRMDNYPDLKAINDFYKSLYKNNWEKYISVFHYMMVKNNFMVKDGISVRICWNKFDPTLSFADNSVRLCQKFKRWIIHPIRERCLFSFVQSSSRC